MSPRVQSHPSRQDDRVRQSAVSQVQSVPSHAPAVQVPLLQSFPVSQEAPSTALDEHATSNPSARAPAPTDLTHTAFAIATH
jgi:hypothetical protein